MITKKGFVNTAGFSSKGIYILSFIPEDMDKEKKEYLVMDVEKCRKITGMDSYLSEYLSNTLRVFTPATIYLYHNGVEVKLPLEKVSWVCSTLNELPDFMQDKDNKKVMTTKEE